MARACIREFVTRYTMSLCLGKVVSLEATATELSSDTDTQNDWDRTSPEEAKAYLKDQKA